MEVPCFQADAWMEVPTEMLSLSLARSRSMSLGVRALLTQARTRQQLAPCLHFCRYPGHC